jgi:hypothetical protein
MPSPQSLGSPDIPLPSGLGSILRRLSKNSAALKSRGEYGRATSRILKATNAKWAIFPESIAQVLVEFARNGVPAIAPPGIEPLVQWTRGEIARGSVPERIPGFGPDTLKSITGRRILLSVPQHFLICRGLQRLINDSLAPLQFPGAQGYGYRNAKRLFTKLSKLGPPASLVLNIDVHRETIEIDHARLEELAIRDALMAVSRPGDLGSDGSVRLEVKIRQEFKHLDKPYIRQSYETFKELLRLALSMIIVKDTTPGCTRFIVEIFTKDFAKLAETLRETPQKAIIDQPDLVQVRLLKTGDKPPVASKGDLILDDQTSDAALQAYLENAGRRYAVLRRRKQFADALRRPFSSVARATRALWVTLFPSAANCYELDEIQSSESIWFANRGWHSHWAPAVQWLVAWPLLVGAFVTVVLCAVCPPAIALWSAVSGTAVSVAGGLVCSQVYSIRACSSGGCILGSVCFTIAHAMILASVGGANELSALGASAGPFTRIVGGWVGIAAGDFTSRPLWWMIVLLATTAFGIASAGKLMGRPYQISYSGGSPTLTTDLIAGANASAWGAGIGFVLACSLCGGKLFNAATEFFIVASALAGGCAVAASLWARTQEGNLRKAGMFGLLTAVAGVVINCLTLYSSPGPTNFCANSFAVGLFHAQFFTAAFVFGHRTSPRAGIFAAAISGVLGYVAFVVFRVLFPHFVL